MDSRSLSQLSARVALSLFALVLASGCASRSPLACPVSAGSQRLAKVFFATDREPVSNDESHRFGAGRSSPPGLYMGWQTVQLGAQHRLGSVDPAVAITPDFQQTKTTGQHSLNKTDQQIADYVTKALRAEIKSTAPGPRGRKQVLLYIHGYNNTFDYAVRKTAQLAGDLGMIGCRGEKRGVPVAYSWPARGDLLSYLADEESTEWTQQRLDPFLRAIANACGAENAELHIVAHSMGSRALIRTLATISRGCHDSARPHFGELVLLAPDMNKELFNQYIDRVIPLVNRISIYVSAKDRALSASRLLHGGYGRVGLIESSILATLQLTGLNRENHRELGFSLDSRIDMIDVSTGLAGPLGHSYEDPAFLRDLHELLNNHTPAGEGKRSNLIMEEEVAGLLSGNSGQHLRYFQLKR